MTEVLKGGREHVARGARVEGDRDEVGERGEAVLDRLEIEAVLDQRRLRARVVPLELDAEIVDHRRRLGKVVRLRARDAKPHDGHARVDGGDELDEAVWPREDLQWTK